MSLIDINFCKKEFNNHLLLKFILTCSKPVFVNILNFTCENLQRPILKHQFSPNQLVNVNCKI